MARKKRLNGFTLPELLIAVAVLAYCLSPLLSTFINSVALNEASRNLLTATSHAEYVMESIKNVAFATVPANQNGASWNSWSFNAAGLRTLGLAVLKNETVTTSLTGTNPIDVTVTVVWSDAGGRNRSIKLRTLLTG